MSLTDFVKENMIGIRENISEREDYYKGLVENFVYAIDGDDDRQEEILNDYYDKNCPFKIKIDGKEIKDEYYDPLSWFTLDIADYIHYGDYYNENNASKILYGLLDEWTDEFVGELIEGEIITEEEADKWHEYYYERSLSE